MADFLHSWLKGTSHSCAPFILNYAKDSSVIKQYPLISTPPGIILIPLPLPIKHIQFSVKSEGTGGDFLSFDWVGICPEQTALYLLITPRTLSSTTAKAGLMMTARQLLHLLLGKRQLPTGRGWLWTGGDRNSQIIIAEEVDSSGE